LNYITKTSELKKFLVDIRHAEFIGMDCEFMRRNTYYAVPSLIQLATKEQSSVIDLITLEDASALFKFLNSSESIFILHGAEQDFEIFADLNIKLKKFIDTQIALTISGHTMQTALEKALESELAIMIDKRLQTTDWSIRPLSSEKINYALSDTLHLIDLYECLEKKLKNLGKFNWLIEDSMLLQGNHLNGYIYKFFCKALTSKKSSEINFENLITLLCTRELKAMETNKPRQWIMSDKELRLNSKNDVLAITTDSKELLELQNFYLSQFKKIKTNVMVPTRKLEQKEEKLNALIKDFALKHNIAKEFIASNFEVKAFLLNIPTSRMQASWRIGLLSDLALRAQ